MNFKDRYQQALAGVNPSRKSEERIMSIMHENRKKNHVKPLIAAVAALALLACGMFTANAATDGALFSAMRLLINGEEVNFMEYLRDYKVYTTPDGNSVVEFELDVSDDDNMRIEIDGTLPNEK